MTNLCTIPGCRIHGRHLPGCQDPACPVDCECHLGPSYACSVPGGCGSEGCGKPVECDGCLPRATDGGYACDACVGRAAARLEVLIEWTADARLVAQGLVRRGASAGSGKPQSRPPLNDAATDTLNEVRTVVTSIARDIAETRGLTASWRDGDPIVESATWLLGQFDWIRHATGPNGEPYAVGVFAEFQEAASKVRWVLEGPSAQRFLGPCGALVVENYKRSEPLPGVLAEEATARACAGDVYGRDGGAYGSCRTCGARVDQQERRAWLSDQAVPADLAWTASGIADALNISVKTIRSWATARYSGKVLVRRARLSTFWRNPDGQLVPWVEPYAGEDVKARGDRLHYVADVKELAEQAAAAREERRAEQERRAQAKESAA